MCCVQSHFYLLWILEPGLLPLSHSAILCEQKHTNIHVPALQYVSAFYPRLLIALTYTSIVLHGYNFRPIVLLWKLFHRCFVNVRRRCDTKASSIIDAFESHCLQCLCYISSALLLQTSVRFCYKGQTLILISLALLLIIYPC